MELHRNFVELSQFNIDSASDALAKIQPKHQTKVVLELTNNGYLVYSSIYCANFPEHFES